MTTRPVPCRTRHGIPSRRRSGRSARIIVPCLAAHRRLEVAADSLGRSISTSIRTTLGRKARAVAANACDNERASCGLRLGVMAAGGAADSAAAREAKRAPSPPRGQSRGRHVTERTRILLRMVCLSSCLPARRPAQPRTILREQPLPGPESSDFRWEPGRVPSPPRSGFGGLSRLRLRDYANCSLTNRLLMRQKAGQPCTGIKPSFAWQPGPRLPPGHERDRVRAPRTGALRVGLLHLLLQHTSARSFSTRTPILTCGRFAHWSDQAIPTALAISSTPWKATTTCPPREIRPTGRDPDLANFQRTPATRHWQGIYLGEHRSDGDSRSIVATLWASSSRSKSDTTADAFAGVYLRCARRGRLTMAMHPTERRRNSPTAMPASTSTRRRAG